MRIRCNYCVKLHDMESFFFCHFQTVKYQFFSDMFAPDIAAYRITCITDMSTSSYIIRVQNIKSDHFTCLRIFCNSGIGLFFKKSITHFCGKILFLRKSHSVIYNLVPDFTCCCCILRTIFSYFYLHVKLPPVTKTYALYLYTTLKLPRQ